MKTTEAHTYDLIQSCDLTPSENTTRRLLEICLALNRRISDLELVSTGRMILPVNCGRCKTEPTGIRDNDFFGVECSCGRRTAWWHTREDAVNEWNEWNTPHKRNNPRANA